MIEQQLKMKQNTGQMPMAPGKIKWEQIRQKCLLLILLFIQLANGNPQSMAVAAAQQQAQVGGGQPDYSKQWAEYYRSIGKIDEAEAIENQIKTKVNQIIVFFFFLFFV